MPSKWEIECDECAGEGFLDYGCTCGEDTCCCAEPDPPKCWKCRGLGSCVVTQLTDDNYDRASPLD
jgi:hypothetical protein